MQMFFLYKIPIDNCWSWRRSTRVTTRAAVVSAIHMISHAWHGDAFVCHSIAPHWHCRSAKNATHFCL